jgi:subtilisin family serine protease
MFRSPSWSRWTVTVLALTIAFTCFGFAASKTTAAPPPVNTFVLIGTGQGAGSTSFASQISAIGGTVVNNYPAIGVVIATSSDASFLAAAQALPGVQNAVQDFEVNWLPSNEQSVSSAETATSIASDPRVPLQWALGQIHADQTYAAGYTGAGARVVVLDAGIITDHPDIKANLNLTLSKSFVPGEGLNPPAGVFNHGTHVAGIIAAPVNGTGIQGVAPKAEIVAVKVLRASGSGQFSWLIEGLEYAASIGADVANMSLGATFDRINAGGDGAGSLIAALNRAINHATQAGILCVSAAGNEAVNLDSRLWSIPAQSGNGIAIAATGPEGWALTGASTNFDRAASYTNYGQSVVNLAAPGGDAALPGNDTCTVAGIARPCWVFDMVFAPGGYTVAKNGTKSFLWFWAAGTSMAAPHVSGTAALIVGKYGHIGPTKLKSILQQTSDDIFTSGADAFSGNGRINAARALGLQ